MAKPSLHAAAAPTPSAISPSGFKMPACFTGPSPAIQARAWAPLVTFAHPKRKDEWNKINARLGSVDEGGMYFIYKDRIERLLTAKLGWVYGMQNWQSKTQAGELVAASFDEQPRPWKEHVEAVVMVYFDDAIYPANVDFRSARCPAAKTLADAALEAAGPEWASKSAAHKETLIAPEAWMRFYGECVMLDARPANATGLPYKPLQAEIKPTGIAEWRLIDAFVKDAETQKVFDMVAERFQSRIKELQAKVAA